MRPSPLAMFFILAYAVSWAAAVPLAAAYLGWIRQPFPRAAHYLMAFGPLVAAVVATTLTAGRRGLEDLLARMVRWRVGSIWWLAAISPLLMYAVAACLLRLAQGTWPDPRLLGQVNFLPNLGIGALLLWLLTFGIGEETGWRGFALPHLQRTRSALGATLTLWVVWGIWHIPALVYLFGPATLADPFFIVGFAVGQLAGAIVFTWLYNSTGSILIVAVWHGTYNFVTASEAGKGTMAAIVSAPVMIWAVIIILAFGVANLSGKPKQVA